MLVTDWLKNKSLPRQWCTHLSKNGCVEVYLFRHRANTDVVVISNIYTLSGFGASLDLYRRVFRDIPAIAENIINPDLDKVLKRIGWEYAFYDLIGMPTRVNKSFVELYPDCMNESSPNVAIVRKYLNERKLSDS